MPCFASATSVRRSGPPAATLCSRSSRTSRRWSSISGRGSPSKSKLSGWPLLFPPEPVTPALPRGAPTITKGHGRLEKRTIQTTTILTKQPDWTGLQQGFRLIRERTEKGQKTVEVVHGITSLPPEQASRRRL